MVCQLEIKVEISLEALRIAKNAGVTTIFNPAPARTELPPEIYQLSDIFCPNETETEMLLGMKIHSQADTLAAARELLERGPKTVILTLGSHGSLLVTPNQTELVPAEVVKAVDTTGAGDAFIGSLAYFLGKGKPLTDAMDRANKIAAISVQYPGTQTSFPDASSIPAEIMG
jgi:ribokinase